MVVLGSREKLGTNANWVATILDQPYLQIKSLRFYIRNLSEVTWLKSSDAPAWTISNNDDKRVIVTLVNTECLPYTRLCAIYVTLH